MTTEKLEEAKILEYHMHIAKDIIEELQKSTTIEISINIGKTKVPYTAPYKVELEETLNEFFKLKYKELKDKFEAL